MTAGDKDLSADEIEVALDGMHLSARFRDKWLSREDTWATETVGLVKRAAGKSVMSSDTLTAFWIRLSGTIFDLYPELARAFRDWTTSNYHFGDQYSPYFDELLVPAANAEDQLRKELGVDRLFFVYFRRVAEGHPMTHALEKRVGLDRRRKRVVRTYGAPEKGLPETAVGDIQTMLMEIDQRYRTDRSASRDIASIALPYAKVIADCFEALRQANEQLREP